MLLDASPSQPGLEGSVTDNWNVSTGRSLRPSYSFQTLSSDLFAQTTSCRSINTGGETEATPFRRQGQELQVLVQQQPLRRLNGSLGIWFRFRSSPNLHVAV